MEPMGRALMAPLPYQQKKANTASLQCVETASKSVAAN